MSFPQPGERPGVTNKGIVLFITCVALFFLTYLFSAVSIALPAIAEEFHPDAIMLSWVSTAAILSTGVLMIPVGRISDIIGIKKMFVVGMIIYTIMMILSIFPNSIEMMIALRAITGVGSSLAVGNAVAMVSASFPAGQRGRALGMTSASVYTGLSAGPFLGGLLTETLGWRSIFIITVPCSILVVVLVLWKIKAEWKGGRGEKFDFLGSLIFMAALTALLYGFTTLPDVSGGILIAAGALGLFVFTKFENRVSSPVINVNVFKNNKTFLLSNTASFIAYSATFALVFLMSLYLQYIKGLSAERAGLVLLAQPVIQACISPFAGRLSDKVEPQIVSSIGMAVTCAGLVLFSFVNAETSLVMIALFLAMLGIGLAFFISPNTNAIMSSVAPKYYGVASAMSNTMRQTGQVFSMAVTMVVITILMGQAAIAPENYHLLIDSVRISFAIFAGLCFCGIFASLARGKVR